MSPAGRRLQGAGMASGRTVPRRGGAMSGRARRLDSVLPEISGDPSGPPGDERRRRVDKCRGAPARERRTAGTTRPRRVAQ
ncbi:hypothetical protein IscW_ISCW004993 [Ixodes scapularis]|uniref:Uncharacterized protein n=1 Tax=Ixodes scapularis TaxID=6945 RepID=B7PFW6_IXOSC|nr:hypothetical protein IscW_ISCW004993 [Ixodes scapularis]|eukprot:XP_002434088.1 hypothetical protein IscW_ISCW004993 [Ixodes scapularis]